MSNKVSAISVWWIVCLFLSIFHIAFTQPVKYSKETIEGLEVYKDFNDPTKFYYAPGALYLEKDKDGKPNFKLLQMRYTGTMATGNQGEIRYMNIVQFKVRMEQFEKDAVDAVRNNLGRQAELYPIPIRNIEAFLVAPFEGKYKRIGQSGSFQADDASGEGSATSFWTERTYTVRLENHEAQLLWDMVERGNIGLSISYTYYADMIGQIEADADIGSNARSIGNADDRLEEITKVDSVPRMHIVRSEAFNIHVDVGQYPDVLVQKDLNEGVPPSYPVLQVMCFDFTDDLRPDLDLKTIEFEAIGVNDRVVRLRSEKFFKNNTDLHTRQIHFPYAVNMRKPLRYRIKEFSRDGELEDSGWITKESWVGGLDITSRPENITFERRTIEFETDVAAMEDLGIEKLIVLVNYVYQGEARTERIEFANSSLPVAVLTLFCDKQTDVIYRAKWIGASATSQYGAPGKMAVDNYAYIYAPE